MRIHRSVAALLATSSIACLHAAAAHAQPADVATGDPAEVPGDPAPPEGETEIEREATETLQGEAPITGRSYTPADFAQFAPQNALDMVSRIPGFSIQGGNNGQRGLGQANQNVLINGQRVSGKSNDARDALSRIGVDAVERIDVVDGATLAIAGLSGEVANVIARAGGWSGNFEYEPEWRPGLEDNWLRGEVSASGQVGGSNVTLSFENNAFRQGHWGPETRRDADGGLIRVIDEKATYDGDRPTFAASLNRETANGNIVNVNGSLQFFMFDRVVTGEEVAADGSGADERSTGAEDEWNFELGGDYEFDLGTGRLKLIGLRRQEHSPTEFAFERLEQAPGAVLEGSRFVQTVDEAESILRSEYALPVLGGDVQFSLEGAYNSLDSEARLFVRDADGAEVEQQLPGANATVEEQRAESILSYGRALGSALNLQVAAGAEYSEISAGDVTRSFVRPKGSVALAWTASDDLTVNAKLERRVDQLSFFDFLSSVDVSNDTDGRSNNFSLVPPQRWRSELQFVTKLGAWGTITPEFRVALIEDAVETIPVSPTEQALGNLEDTAVIYQGILRGTLLFDPIGLEGARLNLFSTVVDSSVEDPLTGEDREISGIDRFRIEADFRHDIPGSDWAWGGGIDHGEFAPVYRLDQVFKDYKSAPFSWLFVEHKDVAGLTVRGQLMNVLGQSDRFDRTAYVGRRTGPIAYTENFDREFGRFFRVTVSGTF
ncbi:TonB-dependent receptor plug domain-containing protein [Sphingomicrobium aestuariivivum]|uniref:TonB-dependent receptor plug domain-containing protein n=1 Tax=Sphingomicrobium aestuariivivum TaxID=1582356 RepID=UPI001FD65620|nr:TonB-dependent receptor plug domain-containing protein [Sphingomicrobium aestuariivivum]MCJ8191206.1 TonB-dependent receptor plug domain-containing protein [Sphingomicrobium aestuariivivum]